MLYGHRLRMAVNYREMGLTHTNDRLFVHLFSWNGVYPLVDQLRDLPFVPNWISFSSICLCQLDD